MSDINDMFDKIYPIGSIYLTITGSKPPIGTWELLDADRFLMSTDTINTLGVTGGNFMHSHTISQLPTHNYDFNSKGTSKLKYLKVPVNTSNASNIPPFIQCMMFRRTS